MSSSQIQQCPDCGQKPEPAGDQDMSAGFMCDFCGFSASIKDIAEADYLANYHPGIDIRATADRIAERAPLKHAQEWVG